MAPRPDMGPTRPQRRDVLDPNGIHHRPSRWRKRNVLPDRAAGRRIMFLVCGRYDDVEVVVRTIRSQPVPRLRQMARPVQLNESDIAPLPAMWNQHIHDAAFCDILQRVKAAGDSTCDHRCRTSVQHRRPTPVQLTQWSVEGRIDSGQHNLPVTPVTDRISQRTVRYTYGACLRPSYHVVLLENDGF